MAAGLKSSATGANLVKEEQNWINITPDILPSSGNLNVSWNFTNWDKSKYPDCYVRIYGAGHNCPTNWPACPMQVKVVNPSSLNKTGIRQIAYTGFSTGAYFLNLQCEVLNGVKNTTVPYESINLDIVPVIINSTARTKTARDAGIKQVMDYVTCKNMPGVNCPEWQQLASQGRSWNVSLGVPI